MWGLETSPPLEIPSRSVIILHKDGVAAVLLTFLFISDTFGSSETERKQDKERRMQLV